ncbi:hypothetical protein [Streptomyces sp. BE308]|uniref:hypothetical protein n=1 Tax=Streptomyces sp. BE308 TaxID=3002529 RepID=UPI002E788F70|nr:hypothetical protein [Streptomyces sp. BE308]
MSEHRARPPSGARYITWSADPFATEPCFTRIVRDWIGGVDAFLCGRRTYDNFARDRPKRNNPDDPIAARLNGLRGQFPAPRCRPSTAQAASGSARYSQ